MTSTAHVLDTIVIAGSAFIASISTVLLADVATPASDAAEMRLLLLPLIGSLVVSGGFIMLNPNPETRRITIGRGIFALFFGVLMPQIIGEFHPALQTLALKPVVLVLSGGMIAGVAYVLSKPFTRGMYERADRVAKKELDRLEQKHFPGVSPETTKPSNPV